MRKSKKYDRNEYLKYRTKILEKAKLYYLDNRERLIEKEKKRYTENREKLLKYNTENNKIYYSSHKEEYAKRNKKNRLANPSKYAAMSAKHRAYKLQRTPNWLTKSHIREITKIYHQAIKGQEVDHIIPLVGKYMSGLHVPWNLRVVSSDFNKKRPKHIKPFIGTDPNE